MLAKDVEILLGSKAVSWAEFLCWVNQYKCVAGHEVKLFDLIYRHEWRISVQYARDWSSAFDIGKDSYCSEPRDKIYGLLGLVNPEFRIEVDYTKPIGEILKMIMSKEIACKSRVHYTSLSCFAMQYHEWQRELGIKEPLSVAEVASFTREEMMRKLRPYVQLGGLVPGYNGDFEMVTEYLKDDFYNTGFAPIKGEPEYRELTEEEERYYDLWIGR